MVTRRAKVVRQRTAAPPVAEPERVLPHNHDAERAVLGGVLIQNEQMAGALGAVRASDFFREAHQRIFAALVDLFAAGKALDLVLLTEHLRSHGQLDDVGGPAYVASLIDGVPTATNVPYYAQVVAEHARLRMIIMSCSALVDRAYAANEDAQVLASEGLAMLALESRTADVVLADAAIREYYNQLVAGTLPAPLATGFLDLDAVLLGGFRPGELVIVAARPSVGKTAFATGVADRVARTTARPVAVFSLEMSQRQMAARLLSQRSRVQHRRLERGDISPTDAARVVDVVETSHGTLLLQCTARTAADVAGWCRHLKQQFGDLALVVVDYLQLLLPERRRASDEAEIAGISRALKMIARDLGVIVLALSQLSRAPEARKDKRPQLADLRGSGALEQDADCCAALYRGDLYGDADAAGTAEVILLKNRDGAVGTVRLAFVPDLALFENLAAWQEAAF